MKKIISGIIMSFSLLGYSQNKVDDKINIIHQTNEITKEEYYPSRNLVYKSDSEKTESFYIETSIRNREGNFVVNGISVYTNNFGCSEYSELIISFENGETINKKSANESNCEDLAIFDLKDDEIEELRTLKIKKIGITNKRSGFNVTGVIKENNYFITLLDAMKNKDVTEKGI